MERLTRKEKKVVLLNNRNIGKNYLTIKQYEKLQQLENIEEKLDIDLITLFSVFKSGLYFIKNNEVYEVNPIDISIYVGEDPFILFLNVWYYDELDEQRTTELYFEDYGKTWWLEKPEEELKND